MVPRPLNYPLTLTNGPLNPGNDKNMHNPADGLLHVLRICTVSFYFIIQARIFIHVFNIDPGCFTLFADRPRTDNGQFALKTILPKENSS